MTSHTHTLSTGTSKCVTPITTGQVAIISHLPTPPCIAGLSYYFLDGVLVVIESIEIRLCSSTVRFQGHGVYISVYDVLVDGCVNEDPLSYQANHHITISGSAAYQLKCTSNNASQTSQTKGLSMEVRWDGVAPGARTLLVAKVWTSDGHRPSFLSSF